MRIYAIFTLCLSNVRKKKLQNGLIGIIIMMATVLLATSITIMFNTENLFQKKHEETNGAHQILTMGNKIHDPKTVNSWWKKQEGVTASELVPFRSLSGIRYQGQEVPNLYLFMMNTPETPFAVDKLTIKEGAKQQFPEKGTVWIPASMADSNGISVGEFVEFQAGKNTFKLSVSAIVVDIPFGGPFTTSARVWMNGEDYQQEFRSMTGTDNYMMALRFDEYNQSASYWERFEQHLNSPYLETKIEYESIASFYLIISKVVGFIMVFLGLIMMVVALFIIGFSISDVILSNYKTIGVIKSLGFTSQGITASYAGQYGLLSIVSIIPGLLASSLLSRIIIESSLAFLKAGDKTENVQGFMNSLFIGTIVFILVILTSFFYANKVRALEPAQAIKYGMSETENSRMTRRLNHPSQLVLMGRLPVQLQIGLKNLLKNQKSSILILFLTALTSSVLVFGFVLLNSILSMEDTASSWGYDSSDIAVTVLNESAFSKKELEKDLLVDSRIENFGWVGYLTGVVPSESTQPLNINISVAEGSYVDLKYENVHGRHPDNGNEVAVGINVARNLNKDVGDVIEIYIEGKKHSLVITGVYQAIANMSYSARVTTDVPKVYNRAYEAEENIFINLKDTEQADRVVSELNDKHGEAISAVTQQTLIDSVFKEAAVVLMLPFSLMGILFITVTFIIIFSVSHINVRKESITYGIYKSIGMTSNKIRWSITSGILILSALGALLGVFAGVKLLPLILKNVLSEYGLIELPLVINWGMSIGISCLSVLAACLGCWISSRMISKTSPRILIVE